jgi:hypothetical protein
MASSLDTFIDSDTFGGSRIWSFISTNTAIHQFTRWLGRRQPPVAKLARQLEDVSRCVLMTTGVVGAALALLCIGTLWLIGI